MTRGELRVQIGIVGYKFSGKTTLYNAVTGANVPTGQGGMELHLAVGAVPDPRLEHLNQLYQPRKKVNAQIEWMDIPGLHRGSETEDRREATRFLEHGRQVDALAQVVCCFDGGYGQPDPVAEIEGLALDLALADLQIVENRLEKLVKDKQKMGKLANPLEPDLFTRLKDQLEQDRPLRDLDLNPDETKLVSGFSFLTRKPMIIVLNLAEDQAPPPAAIAAAERAGTEVVVLCAKVEAELAELDPAEAAEFLAELGISEPAAHRMIRAAYHALNQHSFFTVGKDEVRAWSVRRIATAREAAGVIHSDMERGFIRAVVVAFSDLRSCGDMAAAKRANLVREEGKHYVVQDGDVIEIRFNV
jgi:GTP-binding protein YchF